MKISRHNNLSILLINQDYYEFPKRTITANGKIYHMFKPNKFRDVQNHYQDKASTDLTLDEFRFLTSTCWDKKYPPLPFDKTKYIHKDRYQLGLNSLFAPNISLFFNN